MSKLSPVSQYVASQGINVNPLSQKHLLKYAKKGEKKEEKADDSGDSDDENDYSKFQSKKALEDAKKRREAELEELKKMGADVIDEGNASSVRLPNRVSKGVTIDPNTGTAK